MEGNKVKTLNPGALNHLDNSNGSKASLKPVLVLARTRASHPSYPSQDPQALSFRSRR